MIKRGHLRNFVKKQKGQRPQQGATGERPRRQIRALVNDGPSGIIDMIVGGKEGHMSMRGRKRGRTENESSVEVMQVIEHTPMTISFSQKTHRMCKFPMKMPYSLRQLSTTLVFASYWLMMAVR